MKGIYLAIFRMVGIGLAVMSAFSFFDEEIEKAIYLLISAALILMIAYWEAPAERPKMGPF